MSKTLHYSTSSQEVHWNLIGSRRSKGGNIKSLVDILHDSYVIGPYFSFTGLIGHETRSKRILSYRMSRNRVTKYNGDPYFESYLVRKIPGSRHHVHPLYVCSEVNRTRRKDSELGTPLVERYVGSKDHRELRIDIHYLDEVH